ncbi:ResB protein required for cytochrome c biosynthesis [Xenococcus sp. PCC 7305]|uniref:cytochrome c biogenesis protein ResB n=1 Tax=Xenococcus sp. PCC 7305 TaxID=102125 RepID=UPI0002AC7287|nr:cytochrome c biogenesis protein ResB [Xenococcus sp. PCC 7305]ELS01004.1 ResB protein required for cytochrome c biosynthesis [Xenococcus sp. PCC 7305]
MFDRIFRFISSIKLAVPLLSIIIGILIWATFYESEVGTTTVQQEIYKSPWFGALMFMLALNIGLSALSRYPWRGPRKIGFAITHFGLIVLIAGSAAVIHLGVEGMLLVRTDAGYNDRVRIEGDVLEVLNPDGEIERGNIFIKDDGSVNPRFVAGLELEGYSDSTVKTVNFIEGAAVANPAVTLALHSDRMGQTVNRSLAVAPNGYNTVKIGPAELDIIKAESKSQLEKLLAPPVPREHPWGEVIVTSEIASGSFDLKENQDNAVEIADLKVKVLDFFPDFRLDANNRPISASDKFNNPAILLAVTTEDSLERWFVFGNPDFSPIHASISGAAIPNLEIAYQVAPPQVTDYFKVIVGQDDQLFYAAKSSKGFASGEYAVGESVTPGWADFQITLAEYIPNAKIEREIVPTQNPNIQGAAALLVKTPAGTEAWLPWAEPTAIAEPEGEIYAAFSPNFFELPFAVKLEDFIVDRNEGSQSVAMWTSKIAIADQQENLVEERDVWMNHPTWYKGWKIAQASWNPGDLRQSTLQVKREPTWVTALTWLGSGLVVSGIAIMFYAPALSKKFKKLGTTEG